MWEAWAAGDRKAALAAVPDEVVDALVVHGSPAAVPGARPALRRRRGARRPVIALLPTPELTAGGPEVLLDTLRALGAR